MMMTDDAFIVSFYSFVQMGYFFPSPVVFGLRDFVCILLRDFESLAIVLSRGLCGFCMPLSDLK